MRNQTAQPYKALRADRVCGVFWQKEIFVILKQQQFFYRLYGDVDRIPESEVEDAYDILERTLRKGGEQ